MGLEMNGGSRSPGDPERDRLIGLPRPWWLGKPGPVSEESETELPPGVSFDDEPPVDLSALAGFRLDTNRAPGVGASSARWEDLVARIERAAEPELARRARLGSGVLDFVPFLARSVRPALIAAAAALILGVGLTRFERADESVDTSGLVAAGPGDLVAGQLLSDATDERAILLSTSDDAWIAQQRAPSAAALAEVIGLGGVP